MINYFALAFRNLQISILNTLHFKTNIGLGLFTIKVNSCMPLRSILLIHLIAPFRRIHKFPLVYSSQQLIFFLCFLLVLCILAVN